jgi:hypothetical protein
VENKARIRTPKELSKLNIQGISKPSRTYCESSLRFFCTPNDAFRAWENTTVASNAPPFPHHGSASNTTENSIDDVKDSPSQPREISRRTLADPPGACIQMDHTLSLRDVPDKEGGPIIEPVRGLVCIASLRRPTAIFGHDSPERERQFLWSPLET